MDVQRMREAMHSEVDRMHSVVDRIVDEYLATAKSSELPLADQPVATVDAPLIIRGDDPGEWTYQWWGGEGLEKFHSSPWYEVVTPHKTYRVRLAWGHRLAWGRSDRKRAIIFGQSGPATSRVFYPWTEFVETDTDEYAAQIPNPDYPKKILTPADTLPDRFCDAHVERSDHLFDQIINGPSLRLVVPEADEETMVDHGYWVARLRGRL
jgi:hypothetical protein